ncbi:hypothetical protein RFI_02911, partial [Reticulomyxa filosa]
MQGLPGLGKTTLAKQLQTDLSDLCLSNKKKIGTLEQDIFVSSASDHANIDKGDNDKDKDKKKDKDKDKGNCKEEKNKNKNENENKNKNENKNDTRNKSSQSSRACLQALTNMLQSNEYSIIILSRNNSCISQYKKHAQLANQYLFEVITLYPREFTMAANDNDNDNDNDKKDDERGGGGLSDHWYQLIWLCLQSVYLREDHQVISQDMSLQQKMNIVSSFANVFSINDNHFFVRKSFAVSWLRHDTDAPQSAPLLSKQILQWVKTYVHQASYNPFSSNYDASADTNFSESEVIDVLQLGNLKLQQSLRRSVKELSKDIIHNVIIPEWNIRNFWIEKPRLRPLFISIFLKQTDTQMLKCLLVDHHVPVIRFNILPIYMLLFFVLPFVFAF